MSSTDPIAAPVLVQSKDCLVVESCLAGVTFVGPELQQMAGCPAGPALMLEVKGYLGNHRRQMTIMLPMPTLEATEQFRAHMLSNLDGIIAEHEGTGALRDERLEADVRLRNELGGYIPGGPIVRCPGCNQRLFGEVAVRGGCTACFPDMGPTEGAAPLEPSLEALDPRKPPADLMDRARRAVEQLRAGDHVAIDGDGVREAEL